MAEADASRNVQDSATDRDHGQTPWKTLSVLLIGVFVAQLDQSLVLATYSGVASEFGALESGPWIISAYILAQCAVQPLYGKLSDIYSRKSCLLAAYVLFAVGTAGTGLSGSLGAVVAWRAVQGAGGSGMVSVVSIIVTDVVPRQQIATVRSYVNVLQTMGRSCGGVVGGLLAQAFGWRWAFLVQVPPTVLAIVLVAIALRPTTPADTRPEESQWTKLRRVDFVGAFFLSAAILAVCLVLDLGGQRLPWDSPVVLGLLGAAVAAGGAFVVSARYVREPIFPLRLLRQRSVVTNNGVVVLSVMAQMSLIASVPPYFEATAHASTAAAGAFLIPAFAGNTLGGLLAGAWIRRTGRYKAVTVLAPVVSVGCMVLLLLTWHGDTSAAGSVAILPGGFAMGVVYSSAFVGLVAGVADEDVAVSASSLYLFFNIGAIAGVSAGSAASRAATRSALEASLASCPDKSKIIERALADIGYIWTVPRRELREVLIAAWTRGFHAVNVLGAVCSSLALVAAVASRGTRLEANRAAK